MLIARFPRSLPLVFSLIAVSLPGATAPSWWSAPDTAVLEPGATPHDFSPANLGQLKFVATQAKKYLDLKLAAADGAGGAVNAVCQFSQVDNYAPVSLGQLKFIAKPFYDRLAAMHYDWRNNTTGVASPLYPWNVTVAPENAAPATLGQLKHVFSFEMSASFLADDTDADGLRNWHERLVGTSTVLADTDGDGWNDSFEVQTGANPALASNMPSELEDPDGDGLDNGWEKLLSLQPGRTDSNGNGFSDGLEDADNDSIANQSDAHPGSRTVAWNKVPESRYVVVPLTLPPGVSSARGYGLNNAGQAVGWGLPSPVQTDPTLMGRRVPVVWSGGAAVALVADGSHPTGYNGYKRLPGGGYDFTQVVASPVRWFAGNNIGATASSFPHWRSLFIRNDGAVVSDGVFQANDQNQGWAAMPNSYNYESCALIWATTTGAPVVIGQNPNYPTNEEGSRWNARILTGLPLANGTILQRDHSGSSFIVSASPHTQPTTTIANNLLDVEKYNASTIDGYIAGHGSGADLNKRSYIWSSVSASTTPVVLSQVSVGEITSLVTVTHAPAPVHAAIGDGLGGPGHAVLLSDAHAASPWSEPLTLPPAASSPAVVPASRTFINARGEVLWSGNSTNPTPMLWRNGRTSTLQSLLPPLSRTVETIAAINDSGVILVNLAQNSTMPAGPALLLPVDIGVDNNRDGTLALGGSEDQTTAAKPYRFWLNNDHDNYGIPDTYNAENDHPWTTLALDNANDKIEPERDLDDFARLHLKVESLHSQLAAGTMTLGLKWKTVQSGTPKLRLFKAAETDGGTKYLSDTAKAADQRSVGSAAIGVVQGTATLDIPVSFWTSTATSPTKFFLFEGLGEGKGELTLVFKQGAAVLGEGGSVFLDLLDIRRMYERWKIADAATFSGPDSTATPTVSGVTSVSDPNSYPPFQYAWDEDLTDKSYIICVHGWRKTYYAARSDEITIFKRLWHRGFKGRFAGFYWPTLNGGVIEAKFNHSEYRAWKCGDAFKTFVETQLPADYRKNVIAHSLGNVVVSSALNKGLRFDRYAMLNASIPAQCFDPNPAIKETAASLTWDTRTLYGNTTFDAWAGGDLRDDTLPRLSAMSYRNRVGAVGATRIINFFLPDDWALGGWQANQWGALDFGPGDSKPIDDYDYDVDADLRYNPSFSAARGVTDPHEAMSMVNQSMTKPAGNKAGIGGTVAAEVNLNGAGMLFSSEHEAPFKWLPSKTWDFYKKVLEELGYTNVTP